MACLEQKGLYDVPSESNDDERTPGIVSSVMNSVVEGAERETDRIYSTRLAFSRRGQDIQGVASLVAHWIRICNSNSQCMSTPTLQPHTPEWPYRLIDLIDYGSAASSLDSKVKVIETNAQREPYCALSYRWPPDPVCLTSENSDAWLTGRPSTLLPQPIQDICTLATHLGFRYAWVDALCIMQGPDGDWHREAKKMAAIYMNAKFTVAAADETPLAKAAPVQDFILDSYRLITPDNPKMHHENGIYSELRDTKNIFFREDGVLGTRGWTFQEKMLSRKIISITKTDVFWDCLHHSASGRRPCGLPVDLTGDPRFENERTFRRLLLGSSANRPDHPVAYRQWKNAVQDYTERSFSYGTDRLIALDGIIGRLTQTLEDTCLVGIWRKDAIRCLNWIATSDETNPARPDIETPSWSWLSVNSRISYNFRNPRWGYLEKEDDLHVPMAVIECISAQTEDKRTFAKFSGELRIRGPVISGYVLERTVFFDTQRDQTLPSTSKDGTENTRQMLLNEKSRPEEERVFRHEPLLWDPRPSGPKDNDFRGPLALPSTKNDHLLVAEVKCLLLCEYNEWNNRYTWKTQNYVVLERINGRLGQGLPDISGRKPVYRRI
ncbi:HET-domain-containing protein, partial [Apiospora arundinis]